MKAKHTMWTLEPPPEIDVFTDKPGVFWAIKDESGRIVSLAANEPEGRIIASAPALLDALKESQELLASLLHCGTELSTDIEEQCGVNRAALAQAEG